MTLSLLVSCCACLYKCPIFLIGFAKETKQNKTKQNNVLTAHICHNWVDFLEKLNVYGTKSIGKKGWSFPFQNCEKKKKEKNMQFLVRM